VARIAKVLGGGRELFPWQRFVADVLGEVLPSGEWAYEEGVILAPRRSGKNVLVESMVVSRCSQPSPASVWITGQSRDKAVARWRETRDELVASPLAPVIRSKISNMSEEVRFSTGSTFKPFSPNEDTMHGETPSDVYVDEFWSFSMLEKKLLQQGYRAQRSVAPMREIKLTTAGRAGRSGWLEHDRRRGREAAMNGRTSGIALFEWSVPESTRDLGDDTAEVIRRVLAHHPRAGFGLRESVMLEDLADWGRPEFLRAYGNLDDLEGDAESAIPPATFDRARDTARDMTPPDGARVGVGLALDPDRRESSVCLAWRDSSGVGHVRVVEVGPGTRWVTGRAAAMVEEHPDQVAAVAVTNVGLGRDAGDALEPRLGEVLQRVAVADSHAAAGRFVSELTEGPRVLHDGVVQPEWSEALRSAEVPRGRGWRIRKGALDPVTVLEAGSLALWAADHLPAVAAPPAPFRIY